MRRFWNTRAVPRKMRVEYHPQAAVDLNAAIAHYNELRPGLGDSFRLEVYAAIARMASNPKQFGQIEVDIRRCFVHRFPYSILFRIPEPHLIRVLVIRHHRRHPRFGLGRR